MSIVYAAALPHSPLLIPSIGKANREKLKNTINSLKKIEEDLYSVQPETLIIISPHGPAQAEAFVMNLCPEFIGDFEEFGDFATKINMPGDIGLAHKIKESLETKAALQMTSDPKLDYGSSVPIFSLYSALKKTKIIPLHYCGFVLDAHFQFGQLLNRELMINQERIAIIASGDLSHRLEKKSPAGYSPRGKKFDKKIIDYLSKNKTADLLRIEPDLINEAGECGLKSIVILLGILDGVNYKPQILSYEHPLGVGYMVAKFELN